KNPSFAKSTATLPVRCRVVSGYDWAMIPAATLYPFLAISAASALAGWVIVYFCSRVERRWQERHVKEFSEHMPAPGEPSPWIRFLRSRLRRGRGAKSA